MRVHYSDAQIEQFLSHLRTTLSTLALHTHRARYIETDQISILVNPCLSEENNFFDIPLTIVPLHTPQKRFLAGVPIFMEPVTEDDLTTTLPITWYSHLDEQGRVIFKYITGGMYRFETSLNKSSNLSASSEESNPINVIPLPRQHLQMVPAARTHDQSIGTQRFHRIFQNSNGSLRVTVQEQETGELWLHFYSPHRHWHTAVIGFVWSSIPAPGETPHAQRLLTILTWNERRQACVADMNMGRLHYAFELALPEHIIPPARLTQETIETFYRSIAFATSNRSQQAWRRLITDENLLPDVRGLIERALEQ